MRHTLSRFSAAALAAVCSCSALGAGWTPTDPAALTPPEVSREFRAVWVASVQNIDWPSAKDLTVAQQKAEISRNVDGLAKMNFNAVLLQVRPSCDALYPSTLEPWSEYLTGASGKAPDDPAYDPLALWIDECHARGIDVHVWINPYRARHFKATSPDAPNHISNTNPGIVKEYDLYKWLDPGEPEAVEHTMKVVMDIVNRYDIDGVAIDDYFYPYPKEGVPFPDDESYQKYVADLRAKAGPDEALRPPPKDQWRQGNINRFVERFYTDIKKAKPHVLVGIAPFGIWRPGNPEGIKGMDAVARLHADAKMWLANGWLDYLSPQLYWSVDSVDQNFARLLVWWASVNTQDRHLWPSLYTSRINQQSAEPAKNWIPDEIVRQINITRERSHNPGINTPGQIHFSLKVMLENRGGINKALMASYEQPALVPETAWSSDPSFAAAAWDAMIASDAERTALAWKPWDFSTMPSRWVLWVRRGGAWTTTILPGTRGGMTFDTKDADAVALAPVSRTGTMGTMRAWTLAR